MSGKYTPETLLPALRLFIEARNKANAAGFPDNGGAIHSVERIIDVLCIRVKYGLTHVNNLKKNADRRMQYRSIRSPPTWRCTFITH